MTVGPRRLKDDPDFKWETGCDLADEELALSSPDLAGSRSRLLASVALLGAPTVGDGIPNVRPGSSWSAAAKPVAGMIAAAMVVAGAYWLGTQAGAPVAPAAEEIEVAPPNVDTVISVRLVPAAESAVTDAVSAVTDAGSAVTDAGSALTDAVGAVPAQVDAPAAAAAPAAPAAPTAVVQTARATPPAATEAVAVEAEATVAVADASTAELAPAPPSLGAPVLLSGLPAQLAVFEPAADALTGGHFAVALAGFDQYLARWPVGSLANEARLGKLQATSGVGDAAETSRLAAALQDQPAFAGRRASIVALRVQALIALEHCDEALSLVDQLDSADAADAKKACRNVRRVGP